MKKFTTKTFVEDIEKLSDLDILNDLSNETFLITGATGMLGAEIIYTLLSFNKKYNKNLKIIGLARNIEKVYYVFNEIVEDSNLSFVFQDINDPITYKYHVDYIIHSASITNSKMFLNNPVETSMTTINGAKNVLDFAKRVKPTAVIYLSTMEVYGTINSLHKIDETYVGLIDQKKVRNCYPISKVTSENLGLGYYSEYDVPVRILRLSQTFGSGLAKTDNRVYAQFLKAGIAGNDIVLKTEGNSTTTKCYSTDTVSAIFYALLKGTNGEIYNVSNEDACVSILDMAKIIIKISEKKINIKFEIEDPSTSGYAETTKIFLDTTKIKNLGWTPKVGIEEALIRTREYIIEGME